MKIIGKKYRIRRTLHKNEMHKESHLMRRSNKKSLLESGLPDQPTRR